MDTFQKLDICREYVLKLKDNDLYDHNFFLPDLEVIMTEEKEFTPEEIRRKWLENSPDKTSMYIHVPFCPRKCRYCIYSSEKPEDNGKIRKYLESVEKEVEFFSKLDREMSSLYIGGGTPSILPKEGIEKLLDNVFRNFSFDEGCEKTFEINPSTCTEEKLEVLKSKGINRVSFGVQTLEEDVLDRENRGYQDFGKALEMIEKAVGKGFEEVNADLIAGLEGSKPGKIVDSFRKLASTGVDTVSIYPLQPNSSYLEKTGETPTSFYNRIEKFLKSMKKPLEEAVEEEGFSTSSDLLTNPMDADSWGLARNGFKTGLKNSYRFNDNSLDGCLGFGPGANSYIRKSVRYSQKTESLFTEGGKIFKGMEFSEEKEMRKFLFNKLKSGGKVERKDFRQRFGKSIETVFGEKFLELEEAGIVRRTGESIEVVQNDPQEIFSGFFLLFDWEKVKGRILDECLFHGWDGFKKEIEILEN